MKPNMDKDEFKKAIAHILRTLETEEKKPGFYEKVGATNEIYLRNRVSGK